MLKTFATVISNDAPKLMNRRYILFVIIILLAVLCFVYVDAGEPDILSFGKLVRMKYNTPYILDLKKGNKHLVFYGSEHLYDTTNSIFNDIEKHFMDLNPQIAFYEGEYMPLFGSREKAILSAGESGFLAYLGVEHNVPVRGIEPSFQSQFNFLLKKYSKEEVLLMFFCRNIPVLQKKEKPFDFEVYTASFLKSLQGKGFPISDEEATLRYVVTLYEDFFGEEFNWETFDAKKIYPVYYNNILNEIERELSQFRDRYIVRVLKDFLDKYDRVFILMGSGHAVKQEPVLRSLFE